MNDLKPTLKDYLKIKISVADRVYPLTINRNEEEKIRLAAKKIDGILKKYEEDYAVRDKQDLLAMCALQLAARLEKNKNRYMVDSNNISLKLTSIEEVLVNVMR